MLLGGAIFWIIFGRQPAETQEPVVSTVESSESTPEPIDSTSDDSATAATQAGRYVDYDSSHLGADGFDTSILFFHAAWCPECRAFEQAIESSGVPEGVQILKVDYDSSQDLRSKYGVTVQTTFVRIDSDGNLLSRWVGYGEDKSVTAIIENIT